MPSENTTKRIKKQAAFDALRSQGETEKYKIVCRETAKFPDFALLRVYNKDAEKLKMLEKPKAITGLQSCMTFGIIPEDYDVYVRASAGDNVVKYLKDEFEPVIWKSTKKNII